MMIKHFTAALIAATASLVLASAGAAARDATWLKQPSEHTNNASWIGESGTASYYGRRHQGRRSASGLRFDQRAMTAAHPWLPFGTKVKVTLVGTTRSVVVTITDRLYSHQRIVDLSTAAARRLGMLRRGIAQVTLLPE